jgi:predicted ribonuclease toxin of YeeF-YezG toxin-antitoxin module
MYEIYTHTYPTKNITQTLKENLPVYLSQIESFTNITISNHQKNKILEYIENNQIKKLDSDETKTHRNEFTPELRNKLKKDWELNTGCEWPRYQDNLYVNKKIYRKKNSSYDAHHIIENTYGGPHEWWNLHPASFDQHQNIHKIGNVAHKIFE